jgi:hypothetical protein
MPESRYTETNTQENKTVANSKKDEKKLMLPR